MRMNMKRMAIIYIALHFVLVQLGIDKTVFFAINMIAQTKNFIALFFCLNFYDVKRLVISRIKRLFIYGPNTRV